MYALLMNLFKPLLRSIKTSVIYIVKFLKNSLLVMIVTLNHGLC